MSLRKKSVFFVIILLFFSLIISTPLFKAQISDGLDSLEDAGETIDTYSDSGYWGDKWDYLGKEWQNIFLKNPVAASIDSFFKSISIVFSVLFGLPYSFSLVLFGVIFLWVIFFNMIYGWIKYSEIFDKKISLVLSLPTTVAIAQIGLFKTIVILAGRFILSPDAVWARFSLFMGIVFIIFLIRAISVFLNRYLKAKREADAKDLEKLNRTILGKFVKNFLEMSK